MYCSVSLSVRPVVISIGFRLSGQLSSELQPQASENVASVAKNRRLLVIVGSSGTALLFGGLHALVGDATALGGLRRSRRAPRFGHDQRLRDQLRQVLASVLQVLGLRARDLAHDQDAPFSV